MFSETRYALNGDLRVAYRASREGPRDIVVVPNWFNCCEILPELPAIQGWVEAMTSRGRLIFFDQPGTGASDPVLTGALPTLEQWADSITAVLDDLGSTEAVLVASNFAFAKAHLFARTSATWCRSYTGSGRVKKNRMSAARSDICSPASIVVVTVARQGGEISAGRSVQFSSTCPPEP